MAGGDAKNGEKKKAGGEAKKANANAGGGKLMPHCGYGSITCLFVCIYELTHLQLYKLYFLAHW